MNEWTNMLGRSYKTNFYALNWPPFIDIESFNEK